MVFKWIYEVIGNSKLLLVRILNVNDFLFFSKSYWLGKFIKVNKI